MLNMKKRIHKDPLSAALDHFARMSGNTNNEIGKAVGYSSGDSIIAIRHERTSGSEFKRRAIAEHFGYPYEEFLKIGQSIIDGTFNTIQVTIPTPTMTAQATSSPPTRRKTDIEIQTDKTHEKLVGNFTHKKEAYEVNNELLRLEELEGRDALIEVKGMIKNMIREAEKKLGLNQGSTGTEGK